MGYYYRDTSFNWAEQKPLYLKKWKSQVEALEAKLENMVSGSRESNQTKDKIYAIKAKIKKHSD